MRTNQSYTGSNDTINNLPLQNNESNNTCAQIQIGGIVLIDRGSLELLQSFRFYLPVESNFIQIMTSTTYTNRECNLDDYSLFCQVPRNFLL